MPTRAPRICSCGKVVDNGVRCACQRARKAQHDRIRPNANARGYGSKWREARVAFLASHPACVRCDRPATVVNHKVPHRLGDANTPEETTAAQRLFWRRSNWEAVCRHCHDSIIQSEEKRAP